MDNLTFAITWLAIATILLLVAIAAGATQFAFIFAASLSAIAALTFFAVGLIITYLGGE